MQDYMDVLRACPLFDGTTPQEIEAMLACLSARTQSVPKHTAVYAAGATVFSLGVLLAGSLDVLQEDFWGNQGLLARLTPGDIFAESFVLAQVPALPVSVAAGQASVILLLDYRRILHTCDNTCTFHERLIANLLSILARKNIALTQKVEYVTKRTMREKLLAYLSAQAQRAGGSVFTIPYDRQALADYLAVDRSALSRTLGEMRREGLLDFDRNRFVLLGKGDPLIL